MKNTNELLFYNFNDIKKARSEKRRKQREVERKSFRVGETELTKYEAASTVIKRHPGVVRWGEILIVFNCRNFFSKKKFLFRIYNRSAKFLAT